MAWPEAADGPLARVLRALASAGGAPLPRIADPAVFAARAELHGVLGVVEDAILASLDGSEASAKLRARLERVRVARELDHAAHLAVLARLDEALAADGLEAVALKGALLGERYYERPAARATSDIDLLVRERDLERAAVAIGRVGYTHAPHPEEARFRREHHHLHYANPHALPLELHFHAYRGFGRVLHGEPLLARSVAYEGLRSVRVLSPPDELAFLAVHGAAHRFVRLGWLYDLRLVIDRMSASELARAGDVARAAGFARPLALAAALLHDVLHVDAERLRPLGELGPLRAPLVRTLVGEPSDPWVRSATRLVYTSALCDSPASAMRYASARARDHARRILRPRTPPAHGAGG